MKEEPEKRKRAGRGTAGSGAGGPRPALTERQRAEARRRRELRRRQERRIRPGNALSRGVRATGHELARTARFLARAVAAGFEATGPLGRRLAGLFRRFGVMLAALGTALVKAAGALARGAGRGLAVLDRELTPRRALLAAAALATILLVASQFTDSRAIAIGQPGYAGIQDVTDAPRVDVSTPLGTHSILLLLAAVLAIVGLAGLARGGRRVFGLLLFLSGAVTLAVTLAIDLPAGLDLGDAGLSYAGASALLLSGFWMQLAAGTVLAFAGLLLRVGPAPRPRVSRPTAIRNGSPA